MSLLEKIKKNSTIKDVEILSESKIFKNVETIRTSIPALNIAFSGSITGGFSSGLLQLVAPSRHFKSTFSLIMAKEFLEKYQDGVLMFYNNEFGASIQMFTDVGIDISRVVHLPFTDLEQLTFDVVKQLNGFDKNDHVMIIIDSIGMAASKKEAQDALEGNAKEDMTRAKKITSLARIVTPHLALKQIPMIMINHYYEENALFAKKIVGGGQKLYLASNDIYFISRQQDKDGKELLGFNFVLIPEKSRFVKEQSRIPITVSFDGGISKWSGLLDIALELGFVTKPSNGWFTRPNFDEDGKKYRAKETNNSAFWLPLLEYKPFQQAIEDRYKLGGKSLMNFDDPVEPTIDTETGEILEEVWRSLQ